MTQRFDTVRTAVVGGRNNDYAASFSSAQSRILSSYVHIFFSPLRFNGCFSQTANSVFVHKERCRLVGFDATHIVKYKYLLRAKNTSQLTSTEFGFQQWNLLSVNVWLGGAEGAEAGTSPEWGSHASQHGDAVLIVHLGVVGFLKC